MIAHRPCRCATLCEATTVCPRDVPHRATLRRGLFHNGRAGALLLDVRDSEHWVRCDQGAVHVSPHRPAAARAKNRIEGVKNRSPEIRTLFCINTLNAAVNGSPSDPVLGIKPETVCVLGCGRFFRCRWSPVRVSPDLEAGGGDCRTGTYTRPAAEPPDDGARADAELTAVTVQNMPNGAASLTFSTTRRTAGRCEARE